MVVFCDVTDAPFWRYCYSEWYSESKQSGTVKRLSKLSNPLSHQTGAAETNWEDNSAGGQEWLFGLTAIH